MKFCKAIETVLGYEGGYVDHEDDRGGATKWGITENVARHHNYNGDMKDLSREKAKEIYREFYWEKMRLSEFDDGRLQLLLFDTGVNMGKATAIGLLQKAYNMLTGENISVDGIVGPETINAVDSYPHDSEELIFTFIVMRGEKYLDIVRNRESQRSFIRGWLNRLRKIYEEVSKNDG